MNSAEQSLPAIDKTPASPPESKFACPYPGCGKQYPELWRLRAHYRSPSAPPRGQSGHDTELAQCPRCHMDLAPGLPHIGCRLGYAAPKQARKRKRAQELAARERLLRSQEAQTVVGGKANDSAKETAHGLSPLTGNRPNDGGSCSPGASLELRLQQALANGLAERGYVPSPQLQRSKSSGTPILPPQMDNLVHNFVEAVSKILADGANSTAADSQQGSELAWPPPQQPTLGQRQNPNTPPPIKDSLDAKHASTAPTVTTSCASYTDIFTLPNGPSIEAPSLGGVFGDPSFDGHVNSHTSDQYHYSIGDWGGNGDFGGGASAIGLGGQWVANEAGGCGSEFGIPGSEYSGEGGNHAASTITAFSGGGQGTGDIDAPLAALTGGLPEAASSRPGRAASDDGIGGWGAGSAWKQRWGAMGGPRGGADLCGSPRASSEAGLAAWDSQAATTWLSGHKPSAIGRIPTSSLYRAEEAPLGMRRLRSTPLSKPKFHLEQSCQPSIWEELPTGRIESLQAPQHTRLSLDSDLSHNSFQQHAVPASHVTGTQGRPFRHTKSFPPSRQVTFGSAENLEGRNGVACTDLHTVSRPTRTRANSTPERHSEDAEEARRQFRRSPSLIMDRDQGSALWRGLPAHLPPLPTQAAIAAAASFPVGSTRLPTDVDPSSLTPAWLAPLQQRGCSTCGGDLDGMSPGNGSCRCPSPELLTPTALARLAPTALSSTPHRIASMPQLSPRAGAQGLTPLRTSCNPRGLSFFDELGPGSSKSSLMSGSRDDCIVNVGIPPRNIASASKIYDAPSKAQLPTSHGLSAGAGLGGWFPPRPGSQFGPAPNPTQVPATYNAMFEDASQAPADFALKTAACLDTNNLVALPPQANMNLTSNSSHLMQDCDQGWSHRSTDDVKMPTATAALPKAADEHASTDQHCDQSEPMT